MNYDHFLDVEHERYFKDECPKCECEECECEYDYEPDFAEPEIDEYRCWAGVE